MPRGAGDIDEPTALGSRWADWLRAADVFLLIATAAAGPAAIAILLAHLQVTCPETPCLLVVNHCNVSPGWELPVDAVGSSISSSASSASRHCAASASPCGDAGDGSRSVKRTRLPLAVSPRT